MKYVEYNKGKKKGKKSLPSLPLRSGKGVGFVNSNYIKKRAARIMLKELCYQLYRMLIKFFKVK